MKIPLTAGSVIAVVVATSLLGMALGGAFGYAAARISPDFFRHFVPWKEVEPVGLGTMLGGFGGVFCGGLLGAFAVAVQALALRLGDRKPRDDG